MPENDAIPVEHSPDPFVTPCLLPMLRLSQLPLLWGTAWWNAGVGMLWPEDPARGRCHRDTHAQLVVPAPIESTGEQGLLA